MLNPAGARPVSVGRRLLLALGPLALGLLALLLVLALDPPRRVFERTEYTIPPGTAERVKAGLPVGDVLPQRIQTRVGTALVVRNQDLARHAFGPMVLEPGQQWSRQFAVPGDYALTCSLYPGAGFTIQVAPGPSPNGPTLALYAVLAALWSVVAALVAGGLLMAAARGEGAARSWERSFAGLLLLPGLAAAAALAHVAAMARLVPWSAAAQGPIAVTGWFAVLWTVAAVALARRVYRRPPELPGADSLLLLALALLWPPVLAARPGAGPVGDMLALAGAGLLGAVLLDLLWPRDPGAGSGRLEAPWLLAGGAVLLLGTLPLARALSQPVLGALAVAAGLAVIVQARRRLPAARLRRLVSGAGALAVLAGIVQLVTAVGPIANP